MNTMTMNGINGVNGANGTMAMMNQAVVNGAGSASGPASAPKIGSMPEMDVEMQTRLNTSIYDYFLKHEQYDCARALKNSSLEVKTKPPKGSPGRGQDVNGMDDHSGDDSKDNTDKMPADLPAAMGTSIQHDTSFLLDWFSLFWDMFFAQRKAPLASQNALAYVQQQQRQRDQQRLGYMQPGAMQGAMGYQNMMRMPGGMPMKANLQQQIANRNLTPSQLQGMQAKQQQMMQMQRENSEMALNGQRPRTPSADNAPSPSKRPRLDGPPYNGQMMPNGRPGQGMPNSRIMPGGNQARNMLAAQGMQPSLMSPAQLETFSNQPQHIQDKSLQIFQQNQGGGMPQQHMAGQGSPMIPAGMDASQMELYGATRGVQMGQGGQNGNHALQDYQMQLMLLEQQNKKRLMMARQEQDNQTMRPEGQPGMPGQPGGYPQGMSPQASRSGPSPNPADQMKRGTPKMGQIGLPGSPMPDGSMGQGRNSPGSMGFAMQGGDVFQAGALGVGGNPQMMRPPPSSHPNFPNGAQFAQQQHLDALRQQQQQNGGRMPNPGAWSQGPPGPGAMMSQPGQGQPPAQMGTPRQQNQNTMGPPTQAPPAPTAADGPRPRSPAQLTNPPTPSQTAKPKPQSKKDSKAAPHKRNAKKNSVVVATPATEAENTAPTPTPSTPGNNQHNVNGKTANGPNQNASLQAPTSIAAPQTNNIPPPQPEPQFGGMDAEVNGMEMNFGPIDGEDVLGGFDFDSFLHETGDPVEMTFDASMAFANFEGVAETGEV